jgi:hypothetical protein
MTLAGFTVPLPEISIQHRGMKGTVVECKKYHEFTDILKWLESEYGGKWEKIEKWNVTSNGVEETLPNPHQNSHGLWVYLVRRV